MLYGYVKHGIAQQKMANSNGNEKKGAATTHFCVSVAARTTATMTHIIATGRSPLAISRMMVSMVNEKKNDGFKFTNCQRNPPFLPVSRACRRRRALYVSIRLLDVFLHHFCFLLNVIRGEILLDDQDVQILKRLRQNLKFALNLPDIIMTPLNESVNPENLTSSIRLKQLESEEKKKPYD